jgi:DMSO/TMAO reductase YedYZ molybdopterin-dependent catalytic subunit
MNRRSFLKRLGLGAAAVAAAPVAALAATRMASAPASAPDAMVEPETTTVPPVTSVSDDVIWTTPTWPPLNDTLGYVWVMPTTSTGTFAWPVGELAIREPLTVTTNASGTFTLTSTGTITLA